MTSESSPPLALFRHLPMALCSDLHGLTRPWVRDIAWLLHAENMIDTGYLGRPTLDSLGLEDDERRRTWLLAQEVLEGDFYRRLGRRRAHRLGHYHECLWQWIVSHAPGTRLVAHNLALREGSRTLGELDLLYAERPRHVAHHPLRLHHAELAVKFFLGLDAGPGDARDPARWIGVGSFDSLAIKTHRLIAHQLPMGRSSVAQSHWPSPGGWASTRRKPDADDIVLEQRVIMPGCLFHLWHQRLTLPVGVGEKAPQGLWCRHKEWGSLAACLLTQTTGALLVKPHWLAPQFEPELTLARVNERLDQHFARYRSPMYLRLTQPDGRSCRLFVVNDEWPTMVPLAPWHLSPSVR